MTTQISPSAFEKLNTDLFSQNEIGDSYCKHAIRRGTCPLKRGGSCQDCVPALKVLLATDLDNARDLKMLVFWRLNMYGLGKIDVWPSQQNKRPKPYHSTVSLQEAVERVTR